MFDWLRRMVKPPEGPAGMLGGVTRSTTDPPKRETKEHLEVYEAAPWPRAVGEKVAQAVACCEFELLTVSRNGKTVRDSRFQKAGMEARARLLERHKAEVREVQEHPFLESLAHPNPYMDQHGLLKLTELHLDFVGDAFWLKDRNGLGAPVGYWPIPPHWVMETPTTDRPTFRFGYRSWQATVPAKEVQWYHEPSPANPYMRGTGIGWSLADEIQVDEYAAKMAAAFFFNRARPDFVFVTGMSEDETRRLEQDWVSRLQGFWRAHRPYFLAGEIDLSKAIKEFQQPTMEQLVYPNLRKVQRDIILQTWGVPPELFGIVENSNRATIEAAEYLFLRYVVAPKAERLRSALQRMFIEEFDPKGIIHVDSPVPEDKARQLDAMRAAPWVPTFDEWRAVQGLAPVGNGVGSSRAMPMNYSMDPIPWAMKTQVDAVGGLIRAGFDPAQALEAMGLPPIQHTGLPPVTVQPEPDGAPFPALPPADDSGKAITVRVLPQGESE